MTEDNGDDLPVKDTGVVTEGDIKAVVEAYEAHLKLIQDDASQRNALFAYYVLETSVKAQQTEGRELTAQQVIDVINDLKQYTVYSRPFPQDFTLNDVLTIGLDLDKGFQDMKSQGINQASIPLTSTNPDLHTKIHRVYDPFDHQVIKKINHAVQGAIDISAQLHPPTSGK